ncbi:hypothetical protein PMIN04_008710 [Paraphaeosphaeria minitans]
MLTGSDLSTPAQRDNNLLWEEKNVLVQDFRDNVDYFDIDNHGFTSRFLEGFARLDNMTEIDQCYISAIKDLVRKEIADAGTIFVYDWRIRDSSVCYPEGRVNFRDQSNNLLPSNFAHVDMAPVSIVKRIQSSFPQDADLIFAQRVQAINVWKPLNYPVDQWALAVCDTNTMEASELMETDSVRQGDVTALYYAHHNPNQKWHFLRQQTPEEALIFKHFDSKPDVKSSRVIHASIRHHNVAPDAKPRRSIEVRALVFAGNFEYSDKVSK